LKSIKTFEYFNTNNELLRHYMDVFKSVEKFKYFNTNNDVRSMSATNVRLALHLS
jgi:hypothetical protein